MDNELLLKCLDEFNSSMRVLSMAFASMVKALEAQFELNAIIAQARERRETKTSALVEEGIEYVRAMKLDLARQQKEREEFNAGPGVVGPGLAGVPVDLSDD